MDLPNALTDDTLLQMCVTFNLEPDDVLLTSAKSGLGVALLLPAIVSKVPPPKSMFGRDGPCRARVVDSWFDDHRGVICLIQVRGATPPFFVTCLREQYTVPFIFMSSELYLYFAFKLCPSLPNNKCSFKPTRRWLTGVYGNRTKSQRCCWVGTKPSRCKKLVC